MLILAGAGSGKTRTITYKIAHLIQQGICRPEQILAVTFTNKAAEEMRTRVDYLVGGFSTVPLISTFHSFAVRVLRRYASVLDYRSDFTICDTDDQKSVLKAVYEELKVTDSQIPIRRSQAVISRAKNMGWGPPEYRLQSRDYDREELFPIFNAYQGYLKQSNGMDFDDLILLTVRLFQEHERAKESYAGWYRYLLIDEYQDTNEPQYHLVKHLASVHQNVTAVGDEDQSIYSFRGADIRNILQFESDFPGAVVVKLEQNYRSTQNILDAAISVVSNNVSRKGKILWTKKSSGEALDLFSARHAEEEALFVTHKIYRCLQEGEDKLAVLYRTNFQSRQFEEALRRLQIPYKLVGGVSFYNRKEIKDALAYLRVVQNPADNVSLLRIINAPARGIGRVTLERLHQIARSENASLWRAVQSSLENNVFPAKTHLALDRFSKIIHNCSAHLELPLHLCLEKTIETSGYIQALQAEDTEEAHNRILNLRELVAAGREYADRGSTFQEFLDNAALRSEADEYDETAPVTLMTLHNAKGLEFSIVFLVGCEEGLFPHSRSVGEGDLEEERRLCYVGMTRAQKKLHLTYSRTRRFYGREAEEINQPSRFLMEIPEHLLNPLFNQYFQRPSSEREFTSGARIFHEKYGSGRVLHVEDTGDDLKITVQFPGIGIKKMLQRYAKLRLI